MTAMKHSRARPGDADASAAGTFDALLLTLAWQLLAVIAIGLITHAGMLAFEGCGIGADTGVPTARCRTLWVASHIGSVDLGADESDCDPKRGTSRSTNQSTG